jgi:hypothetical protein
MISGLAQVMAMKPILRSFFSSGPRSCAMACSAPMGSTDAMAARAVLTPTAFRKPRRTLSTGNSALTSAASMKSRDLSSCDWTAVVGLGRVVLAAGAAQHQRPVGVKGIVRLGDSGSRQSGTWSTS